MAAFVGVAATGVAIARAERERRAYTPDQVRERLHARAAELREAQGAGHPEVIGPEVGEGRFAVRLRALRTRVAAARPVATTGRLLRGARQRLTRATSNE
ncbi:hypothetical protein [Nocardiopsis alkaliphila]|uniref:hypothetical protein n=1 Tax=Nocardiopsis alkaliphila TaxID=225762 RepID=UPI00034A0EBA|nr:hypothetical protein [Nocardiopsis alkaliphila]